MELGRETKKGFQNNAGDSILTSVFQSLDTCLVATFAITYPMGGTEIVPVKGASTAGGDDVIGFHVGKLKTLMADTAHALIAFPDTFSEKAPAVSPADGHESRVGQTVVGIACHTAILPYLEGKSDDTEIGFKDRIKSVLGSVVAGGKS